MKVPVILVTGFLGSGKTTFLRRLAERHPDWHMLFLVNEFADFDVDGEVLAATGTSTHSVVGGSLFCECKAGDFLRIMREEVLEIHRRKSLDAVVIETSGTADPDAIGQLMLDHGLGNDFEVRSIVSIVAPARFRKMFDNLPVIQSQILVSDMVVINKTDTVDTTTIEAVESMIRTHNSKANIVRAEHCRVDFILPMGDKDLPKGALATCDANPFDTATGQWPKTRGIKDARSWLEELPAQILRIKGQIQTPEGTWTVERTVDTLSLDPVDKAGTEGIVLIAHERDFSYLKAAQHSLASMV